jgi:CBS domain containing-hemolysin-like protein
MDPASLSSGGLLFDLAWIYEPTAWVGLLTLTLMQVVLGLDNLLFIAILSAKLPPRQSRKARYIGLGGSLVIRLILMLFAAYIIAMKEPLFSLFGLDFSYRDVVMLAGGLFLLYKSTEELHGKLEGTDNEEVSVTKAAGQSLATVATQIMILDVLFSVDAIITAVAMTNHLMIMAIAVTFGMGLLTWASGMISRFVSRHPTLVILCLGFLLLIGFSLIMEALHFEVPKGYLYSAMAFSVLIEVFNQVSRKNVLKLKRAGNMQSRELAANLVLRLLGSRNEEVQSFREAIYERTGSNVFNSQEKEMVSRVLQLSSLPVKAILTARNDLQMLKIDGEPENVIKMALNHTKTNLVAYRHGQKDQPLGFLNRSEVLGLVVENRCNISELEKIIQQPLYLPETVNILKVLEEFRSSKKHIAFIFDEFGNFEGLVTLHDVMEEFAGDMPDKSESAEIVALDKRTFRVDAEAVLADVYRITGLNLPNSEHYQTLAGFILDHLQRVPTKGESIEYKGWKMEITQASLTSINEVKLTAPAVSVADDKK